MASLFRFGLVLAVVYQMASAAPAAEPNSCNPPSKDLQVIPCMSDPVITFNPADVKVTPYPPSVSSKTLDLTMTFNNTGPALDSFKVVVSQIEEYKSVLFKGCEWKTLIDKDINSDGCKLGDDVCPVPSGEQTMSLALDISKLDTVLKIIGTDKYFSFTVHFQDSSEKNLMCAQIKMYFVK
eukprot:TRINITY_DN4243_c0_g1_i2.p1 TRINITY_DN4243_c0_g1~~TRINITY_DN4243_c0_g1_i2.p1  ORF type:complete len:181 (+),score=15.19 TRINITY_DN4243_c0_g1_i2:194-736(+)